MASHKCGSCFFFQEAGFAGNGWCLHKDRARSADVRTLVRRNELACRNDWGTSLWTDPREAERTGAERDVVTAAAERPATPNEIGAMVSQRDDGGRDAARNAAAGEPERRQDRRPDAGGEDVVVGQITVVPPGMTGRRRLVDQVPPDIAPRERFGVTFDTPEIRDARDDSSPRLDPDGGLAPRRARIALDRDALAPLADDEPHRDDRDRPVEGWQSISEGRAGARQRNVAPDPRGPTGRTTGPDDRPDDRPDDHYRVAARSSDDAIDTRGGQPPVVPDRHRPTTASSTEPEAEPWSSADRTGDPSVGDDEFTVLQGRGVRRAPIPGPVPAGEIAPASRSGPSRDPLAPSSDRPTAGPDRRAASPALPRDIIPTGPWEQTASPPAGRPSLPDLADDALGRDASDTSFASAPERPDRRARAETTGTEPGRSSAADAPHARDIDRSDPIRGHLADEAHGRDRSGAGQPMGSTRGVRRGPTPPPVRTVPTIAEVNQRSWPDDGPVAGTSRGPAATGRPAATMSPLGGTGGGTTGDAVAGQERPSVGRDLASGRLPSRPAIPGSPEGRRAEEAVRPEDRRDRRPAGRASPADVVGPSAVDDRDDRVIQPPIPLRPEHADLGEYGGWFEFDSIEPRLSPELPRSCETCRSFRPAGNSARGWCTNPDAFTLRTVVNASDLPCISSFGCWWVPYDDVWLSEAGIREHRNPTPFLDQLGLADDSPDPRRQRRQS